MNKASCDPQKNINPIPISNNDYFLFGSNVLSILTTSLQKIGYSSQFLRSAHDLTLVASSVGESILNLNKTEDFNSALPSIALASARLIITNQMARHPLGKYVLLAANAYGTYCVFQRALDQFNKCAILTQKAPSKYQWEISKNICVHGMNAFYSIYKTINSVPSWKDTTTTKRITESHSLQDPKQLDESLCSDAKPYLNSLSKFPRASDGKVDVRLLPDLVIKQTNREDAESRMVRGSFARELSKTNQYQHLIIPESCILSGSHDGFSIERRLPISTRENAIFNYYQNPLSFTESIKEFTKFLIQTDWTDLVPETRCIARYDNAAPYIENTENGPIGKIAMVDLEHLTPRLKDTPDIEGCKTAITFFPYHYDTILNIAKANIPNINQASILELEKRRDCSLDDITMLYTGQWNLLKKNQITHESITSIQPISYTQKQEQQLESRIIESWKSYLSKVSELYSTESHLNSQLSSGEISNRLFGNQRSLVKILESITEPMRVWLKENTPSKRAYKDMSLLEIAKLREIPVNYNSYTWEKGKRLGLGIEEPIKKLIQEGREEIPDLTWDDDFYRFSLMPSVLKSLVLEGFIGKYSGGIQEIGGVERLNRDYSTFYI